ncbi:MAG: HIT domain-containing protein [Nanoarchaeota archaeon]
MISDCIFCKISSGKVQVARICENANFFSIPDANPKTDGHSLVISKNHYATLLDLPTSLGQELVDCIKNTSIKLMKEKNASGFNLINNNFVSAGQVVNHVHLHIIPRKEKDGLNTLA